MIKVQITLVASPIISVPSDELVAQIHDRMPLIL
jgi:putative SOS response-associated peptidase YedK